MAAIVADIANTVSAIKDELFEFLDNYAAELDGVVITKEELDQKVMPIFIEKLTAAVDLSEAITEKYTEMIMLLVRDKAVELKIIEPFAEKSTKTIILETVLKTTIGIMRSENKSVTIDNVISQMEAAMRLVGVVLDEDYMNDLREAAEAMQEEFDAD